MRTCLGSQCETNNACRIMHWREDDRPPPSPCRSDLLRPGYLHRAGECHPRTHPLLDAACSTCWNTAGGALTIYRPSDRFVSSHWSSLKNLFDLNVTPIHSCAVPCFPAQWDLKSVFIVVEISADLNSSWLKRNWSVRSLAECFWVTAVRLKCVLCRSLLALCEAVHRPDVE